MTTIVHDTYATASDSYIIGRTANIVGGTWAAWNTVYGTADFQIFSATGVCRAQSGDPFWFTNSTSNSGSPTTDAIEFTPYADNWLICALLNVSGATGYNVVFSPTGVYINVGQCGFHAICHALDAIHRGHSHCGGQVEPHLFCEH